MTKHKLISLFFVVCCLAALWFVRNYGKDPSPAPVAAKNMKAEVKPVVKPSEPVPHPNRQSVTVLALDRWTLDEILSDPQRIVDELRLQFSGKELTSRILGIGSYIKTYGRMDDLHKFMSSIDIPSVTTLLTSTLISMATEKGDAENLIRYAKDWDGQAESRTVQHQLLQKAGMLNGMNSLKLLLEKRGDGVTSAEITAVLGGAAKSDPSSAREWLLSSENRKLSVDEKAAILNRLADQLSLSDIVKDATVLSAGDSSIKENYLMQIFSGNAVRKDPKSVAGFIETTDSLTDEQRGRAAQQVAASWGGQDLLAASGWVVNLPKGHTRDYAVYGLLNAVHNGRLDMPEAAQWAASIADPKLRDAATRFLPKSE